MTVNAEGQGPSIDVTGDGSEVTVEVTTGSNVGGGGGVDDHGALTGLADDDHTQYLTAARGDARYDDRGQDSAATGLYAFSDFSRMTAGTIHNQGSSGTGIGDPVTWVDGRTAGGAGIDAFIEVCEIVSGVLRHRGTRLSAVGAYLLPGGASGTPAHGTAHTATVGCVADTTQAGENGPSFVQLGFLDGDNSNGYLGYLKAASSSANHEVYIVRDDAGVPGWSTTPVSLGRRLGPDDRFTFTHYGNTFAVLVNGVEITRATETTHSASTFNVTNVVLSSEGTSGPPPGANLPGIAWHALSTGSPLEPVTPRAHAASHQDGGSDELALDASQTTSGQFNVARLGSGTPTSFTFLNGLGEWTADVPVYVPVKNTSGSTIAKGAPVYATGTVGSTSTIEIAPADADDSAKMPAIGLTESALDPNEFGYVIVVGTLKGVDTQGLAINAPLYVSTTAGQLTITKPTGASELIQNIGRVIRANQNSGEILVLGPGRTNDVPNSIDAGKLTSGTVATARLGSGTANSSSYLRGDQTWATITAGDVVGPASSVDGRVALFDGTTGKLLKQSSAALAPIATSGSGTDITTGTVAVARLATQAAPTATPFTTDDWVPLWTPWGSGATNASLGGTANASDSRARYQPLWIGQSVGIKGLGIDVQAGNAGASAVVRLGIHDNAAGRPGDVVVDASTASLNTTGAKELTFSSVTLNPGWYWLVIATQSLDTAGTNPAFRATTSAPLAPVTSIPSSTASQDNVFFATVAGALADDPSVTATNLSVFVFKIWGKFA